jgi:hypothetical protein
LLPDQQEPVLSGPVVVFGNTKWKLKPETADT